MKKIFGYLAALAVLVIVAACSNSRKTSETADTTATDTLVADIYDENAPVPFVDLDKEYPKKTIYIEDIADVRYVPLETNDSCLISFPHKIVMRDSLIIITDKQQDEIFLFNTDGKYLNKISHKGSGPMEYHRIYQSCVDFDRKLVYILDLTSYPHKFKAYDFDGSYNYELPFTDLELSFEEMEMPDKDNIIFARSSSTSNYRTTLDSIPFRKINVFSGEVTPVDITVDRPGETGITYVAEDGRASSTGFSLGSMYKVNNDIVLSDYTHPMVYIMHNGELRPLLERSLKQSPSQDFGRLSSVMAHTDRYIFIQRMETEIDRKNTNIEVMDARNYMYDRKTDTMVEIEDILSRDSGKRELIEMWGTNVPRNTVVRGMPIFVYKGLSEKGKLKGRLKELVDSLDDEANPILTIMKFK